MFGFRNKEKLRKAIIKKARESGSLKKYEFVALDIETTGASEIFKDIYEIAMVHVKNGKVKKEYKSFIRVDEISLTAMSKRGLYPWMVETFPTYEQVMKEVKKFIGDKVVVAHNKSFDSRFVTHKMATKIGHHMTNEWVCTLELARKNIQGLPNYKLGTLAEYLSIENRNPHQALSDARVCADIMCVMLGDKPCATVYPLHKRIAKRMIRLLNKIAKD